MVSKPSTPAAIANFRKGGSSSNRSDGRGGGLLATVDSRFGRRFGTRSTSSARPTTAAAKDATNTAV